MPWNLSSDERLAGFLNRILPSAGGSSSVEEINESGSAQCGRGLPCSLTPMVWIERNSRLQPVTCLHLC